MSPIALMRLDACVCGVRASLRCSSCRVQALHAPVTVPACGVGYVAKLGGTTCARCDASVFSLWQDARGSNATNVRGGEGRQAPLVDPACMQTCVCGLMRTHRISL